MRLHKITGGCYDVFRFKDGGYAGRVGLVGRKWLAISPVGKTIGWDYPTRAAAVLALATSA